MRRAATATTMNPAAASGPGARPSLGGAARGSKLLRKVVMMERLGKASRQAPSTANKTCKCRGKCTPACLRKQAEEAAPPKQLTQEAQDFLEQAEKWKGTKNCITDRGVKTIRHKDTVMKEVMCLNLNGFTYTSIVKKDLCFEEPKRSGEVLKPNSDYIREGVRRVQNVAPLNGRLLIYLQENFGRRVGNSGTSFAMIQRSLKVLHARKVTKSDLGQRLSSQYSVLPGDIISFRNCEFQGKLSRESEEDKFYSLRAGNPVHLAVVLYIQDNFNVFTVFEQSADDNYVVTLGKYRLSDRKEGAIEFFRPRDRNKEFIEL